MGTYPTSPRAEFLSWCQAHGPVFTSNAASIGLTPAQAAAFNAATGTAEITDGAAASQRFKAQAATATASAAFAELRRSAAEMVRSIRTFAENTNDPAVYQLAEIPAPADPSTLPPPGQPTDLSADLDPASGDITLRWKSDNPPGSSGTSYIIRRKKAGEAVFTFVGVSGGGARRFVDSTFTAGPDSVQYTVQGQRADSSGPVSNIFTINFGRAPTGFTIESVSSEGGEMKLAA